MFGSLFRSLASLQHQKRFALDGKQMLIGTKAIEPSLHENPLEIRFDPPFDTDKVLVLAGLQNPNKEGWTLGGVEICEVTSTGFRALVEKTDWQLLQRTTLHWVATESLFATRVINVYWGPEGLQLDVDPYNLEVTEPTEIFWETAPGEDFNIVGVLGLDATEFGVPLAHKLAEGFPLRWYCLDAHMIEGTFSYSILAEKNGEVRFLDPKITNKPGGPGEPPPEPQS